MLMSRVLESYCILLIQYLTTDIMVIRSKKQTKKGFSLVYVGQKSVKIYSSWLANQQARNFIQVFLNF